MMCPTDKSITSYYQLLTKKELARLLNCTERTVDRMTTAGQLPFTMIPTGSGGRLKRRYIMGAIAEWMEQYSVPARQNAEDN